MIVLLLAIALRSAVWNIFQLIHHGEDMLLLGVGLAAMAGKMLGGFAADTFGWRRYTVAVLLLASPLLMMADGNPWLLMPGIFLLQSATPAAVTAMWSYMPDMPATAAGMCFGLALVVGGLPFFLGLSPDGWWAVIGLPVAAIMYALTVKSRKLKVEREAV